MEGFHRLCQIHNRLRYQFLRFWPEFELSSLKLQWIIKDPPLIVFCASLCIIQQHILQLSTVAGGKTDLLEVGGFEMNLHYHIMQLEICYLDCFYVRRHSKVSTGRRSVLQCVVTSSPFLKNKPLIFHPSAFASGNCQPTERYQMSLTHVTLAVLAEVLFHFWVWKPS